MKNIFFKSAGLISFLLVCGMVFNSCDFEFVLPEAGSLEDASLPTAGFSFSQTDPEDFTVVTFANESSSAISYAWDLGDAGATSTEANPSHAYPGEGTYVVTLTATDGNGVTATSTVNVEVIEPEEPDAIVPTILNGDFSAGQDDWKISSFPGGTTSPFNSSSDGSNTNYDGSDNGSKTAGAKWTSSTSAGEWVSSSTRYAYQAITISPDTDYILEYEYAIKTDAATDPAGGRRIVGEILNGHFSSGPDAVTSSGEGTLARHVGTDVLGKGNFTLVKEQFTSNSSGLVSIWIYGVTPKDAYVDNVKVYPVD